MGCLSQEKMGKSDGAICNLATLRAWRQNNNFDSHPNNSTNDMLEVSKVEWKGKRFFANLADKIPKGEESMKSFIEHSKALLI